MHTRDVEQIRGSAWELAKKNPLGEAGQQGCEIDTGKVKLFDGRLSWNDLPYADADATAPAAADISDATAVGIALITAATQAAGRTAIGAGTSSFALATAPAAATSTGTAGQIAVDTGFVYVCTATNTWKRVAVATWP